MEPDKHFHALPAQAVFGEEVSWVGFSSYLPQVDSAEPYGLLNPQSVGVEMTELAEALPVADANGCTGIGPDAQARRYAEIP